MSATLRQHISDRGYRALHFALSGATSAQGDYIGDPCFTHAVAVFAPSQNRIFSLAMAKPHLEVWNRFLLSQRNVTLGSYFALWCAQGKNSYGK